MHPSYCMTHAPESLLRRGCENIRPSQQQRRFYSETLSAFFVVALRRFELEKRRRSAKREEIPMLTGKVEASSWQAFLGVMSCLQYTESNWELF